MSADTKNLIWKSFNRLSEKYTANFEEKAEFRKWQKEIRNELAVQLHLDNVDGFSLDGERSAPRFKTEMHAKLNGFVQHKIQIMTEQDFWVPAFLCIPDEDKRNGAGLICLPGNGRGIIDLVGLADVSEEKEHIKKMNYNYALKFAKLGFTTLCIELRGAGELMYPEELKEFVKIKKKALKSKSKTERQELFNKYLWMSITCKSKDIMSDAYRAIGRSLKGAQVMDVIRAVDFMLEKPEIKDGRLGVVGFSSGGAVANLAAAMDKRIQALVASCIMQKPRWDEKKEKSFHFLSGRSSVVSALIAPRPACYQYGKKDPVTRGENAKGFQDLTKIYKFLNADKRLLLDLRSGGHRFRIENPTSFFEHFLVNTKLKGESDDSSEKDVEMRVTQIITPKEKEEAGFSAFKEKSMDESAFEDERAIPIDPESEEEITAELYFDHDEDDDE